MDHGGPSTEVERRRTTWTIEKMFTRREPPASPRPDHNQSVTSFVAAHRTLAVTELLEKILLELSVLDLLLATRVSRKFQAVILDSKVLRTALFFDAEPENPSARPKMNPLLSRMFPRATAQEYKTFDVVYDDSWVRASLEGGDMDLRIGRGAVKPLVYKGCICHELHGVLWKSLDNLSHDPNLYYIHLPAVTAANRFTPAQSYKRASWRRMYATNPPLTTHVCVNLSWLAFGQIPAVRMGAIMWRMREGPRAWSRRSHRWLSRMLCKSTDTIKVESEKGLEHPRGHDSEKWSRHFRTSWIGTVLLWCAVQHIGIFSMAITRSHSPVWYAVAQQTLIWLVLRLLWGILELYCMEQLA